MRRRYRAPTNLLSTQAIAFKYIFAPKSRLSKAYNYILWVFPWKLKFDGQKVAEKMLEARLIEERHVKRGTHGQIFQVYFREFPSQEHVEIACLGLEGVEEIDELLRRGVLKGL